MESDLYQWYQCDILDKNNMPKMWCRFIAKNDILAKANIEYLIDQPKYSILIKKFIKSFIISRVPDEICNLYQLNFLTEVEEFHKRLREKDCIYDNLDIIYKLNVCDL